MNSQSPGVLYEGKFTSTVFYPNAIFPYTVYIPPCEINENVGLCFMHDGFAQQYADILNEMADEGQCPYCVFVGVQPGTLPSTVEGGIDREIRMNTYDVYSERHPDFIVDELLPYLFKTYDLHISDSPDMHLVLGGSSGGLSAWNIAWHRTDYFRRVCMNSPSFLSMGKGDELINLIRKFETKPIRVQAEFSENEPDDYFGSSYCVADAAIRALKFSNYDLMDKYYPGEGHCSRGQGPKETIVEKYAFLWKNWKTEPIKVNRFSPRVEKVVSTDSHWEYTYKSFPKKSVIATAAKGTYIAQKDSIIFMDETNSKRIAANGFGDIRDLAISSDNWRLYIADAARGCVYACTIHSDGSLDKPYVHGNLHLKSDFRTSGAVALCVDQEDRVYAATEIGIQLIRSYGLIDVIMENPNNQIATRLILEQDGYLYAQTASGCYRRKLQNKLPADPMCISEPKQRWYYD